jgi:K+-transporting ATPase KdpF subunit
MHIHPIAAVALACSVLLLVYLVMALLFPEKF